LDRGTITIQDPVLVQIVERLVGVLHPERIYLFGSRARGDATPGSDYDVLVVVEERTGAPYELEQSAYRSLWGLGAPVDVVVVTREHFEQRCEVITSLPATIQREGRLLYAA
jgi:predicted nucleotidyltransferase